MFLIPWNTPILSLDWGTLFFIYLLKKLNLQLAYNDTTISVVMPNKEIQKHLEMSEKRDVVLSTHISYLTDNTPFEYTETYYHADQYSFRYQCYRQEK